MLFKKYNSHLFWTLKYLWLLFFLHIALAYGCGVVVVQSVSHFQLFATPRIIACQASLSLTISQSLLKLMSIKSVTPFNQLILCHSLFLPPSIFPSMRIFSNELALCIRWLKYWSFIFHISPSSEYSGFRRQERQVDWRLTEFGEQV